MIEIHKRILWGIVVLLSAVGPYCFSQSQTYSASDLACNSPGNAYLNILHHQIGAAAPTAVSRECHEGVNGGADGSSEVFDNFVRGVEVANERIDAQGSRGVLTEAEAVDRRGELSSGRRSWREIIINW